MSPKCKLWGLLLIGGLEQASLANAIFLFIDEAKTCWKAIFTCYLKNWMQKEENKWSHGHLLCKNWTHSLIKWSISCPNTPCTSMTIKIKWCLSRSGYLDDEKDPKPSLLINNLIFKIHILYIFVLVQTSRQITQVIWTSLGCKLVYMFRI